MGGSGLASLGYSPFLPKANSQTGLTGPGLDDWHLATKKPRAAETTRGGLLRGVRTLMQTDHTTRRAIALDRHGLPVLPSDESGLVYHPKGETETFEVA